MTKLSKINFLFRNSIGKVVNTFLHKVGLRIVEISANPQYDDVGRDYSDLPTVIPNFQLRPGIPKPFAGEPAIFTVNNGSETIEEEIFYSHLTLLKMLKHFEFESVLDIGSHEQRVTRLFRHLGKKVSTIEIAHGHEADYNDDYLNIDFQEKFGAVWCSAVLEHQRNIGQFLDKIFDDLQDGGVLALTNPFDMSTDLTFGHCGCLSPLVLLYHLVLAGFDCSKASLRCYNYSIGIIVKKKYNGIPRRMSFAMEPNTPDKQEIVNLDGKQITVRDIMANQTYDRMAEFFPFPVTGDKIPWRNEAINWGDPI
jgi:SAM-dependent methyltransferase